MQLARRCRHLAQGLGKIEMAKVYIEATPIGHREGSPITGYVIEDAAHSVLAQFQTQSEAIAWAKRLGHHPLVARVRHFNNKLIPDHWRAA
jgi:hypothetical protein